MSNGDNLPPKVKILSMEIESNPPELTPVDVSLVETLVSDPPNATPETLYLTGLPKFSKDENNNFYFTLTWSGGYDEDYQVSDMGAAVINGEPAKGSTVVNTFKCTWEGNQSMPPVGNIFIIKVTAPADAAGGERKKLKWAFTRQGK